MKTDSFIESFSQTELIQKVSSICNIVNSAISTRELLEDSLKQTIQLFGASRGSIFILDKDGQNLILQSAEGMARAEAIAMVKKMGEGIVGHVALKKEPVFVDDITTDKRFSHLKPSPGYRTPSFICAPLMIKDTLIGVINITDKHSGHHFKANDLQLLDFLTSQMALNYRRIELYSKFKIILKETQSLKNKLGETDQEKKALRHTIEIQERLATIGKLAGGIAHEFNNPLDGVIRYTNLCLDHAQQDELLRNYLLEIKNGLNRMAKIVKNLLACSRNEKTSDQKIDLRHAIENILKTKQMEIESKKIKIKKNISDKLPLIKDFGIERVLANVISNAFDAVKNNDTVSVSAQLHDGDILIEIFDTGEGIAEEHIDKIFEPFYTTKDIDKGCGLGLTIAGEIIKIYNGKITVKSEPGRGTTFAIALPQIIASGNYEK